MDKNKKNINFESPLFWPSFSKGTMFYVLDETLLPEKKKYIRVTTVAQAINTIKKMKTRAFGQFLVVLNTFLLVLAKNKKSNDTRLIKELQKQLSV